jgi:hypothetical protein
VACALVIPAARARCDDQPEASVEDGSEPDHLATFYRAVALPPYLERRVQAILEAELEQARANAEKVGLRRMSRRHYRRSLVALDRSTDAKIRALIGPKKFLAWNRARVDPLRNRPAGVSPLPRAAWTRDRCAGLGRLLLQGPVLGSSTVEQAHCWIHDHARHC